MIWRRQAWRLLRAVRTIDVAVTRRDVRRAVLVDGRTPMNYAMVAPVRAAMAADSRVRFYFTSSEAASRTPEVYPVSLPAATRVSPRRAACMRFDAYLTADLLWATLPRGTRRIQMFHGVSGKFTHDYDTPRSSMRRWDRLFFVNRRRMQNFIAAGAIDADSGAARLIGMPKVDCLVDGSLDRDDILLSHGLNPERPTVLYAPTWSAASSLNVMGIDLVDRLLARSWNVIVKLHDRSLDPRPFYSGGIDWRARLQVLLEGRTGHLAICADICPYLAAADAMITDHSSAGFEYLLLDRPIIRIHVPELLRATNINPDYVSLLAEAATSVEGPVAAVAAIEHALASPHERSAARRAVAQELFYLPGTATARAVEELYRVLELPPVSVLQPSRDDCHAPMTT